ncbi:GNAT family N-acetyltransferase [Motilimonas pumila]|uniref:N-acetyltransferase n=1 Tax=Motilimonas pumila TaxID=2303987 RepID=A0A418YJ81_9GAMM|nr:GNAT family N-acetyltransferase [Motilimonas pumila]RJG50706.1 N-acetyltransferase [Motilimonas pumila]
MNISHKITSEGGAFYTLPEDENSAVMRYLSLDNQVISVNSTKVPEQFRGQGVAMKLMQAMIEYAEQQQLKVVPACSYVEKMFERYPQWQHLLAEKA